MRLIASSAVSNDKQLHRPGIFGLSHLVPPMAKALYGESYRVLVNAYVLPTGIVSRIEYTIRCHISRIGTAEIVDVYFLCFSRGVPWRSTVRTIAQQILLLDVDRHYWHAC